MPASHRVQNRNMRRIALLSVNVVLAVVLPAFADGFSARFEEIKKAATPRQLYQFLFDLPKGGDLHNHGGLASYAEVWFTFATDSAHNHGNRFYTLTRFANCPGDTDALPRFYTVQRSTWEKLPTCFKGQYEPLNDLTPTQRSEWISSMMLDKPGEGRNEFFEVIVRRFGDLFKDPYLAAEVMVENMRLFGLEHVRYIETQILPTGFLDREGNPLPPAEVARIFAGRMGQPDAKATGVTIRFQDVVIRFLPDAEKRVEDAYDFVSRHRDWWVGINMAGREDNEKGYALRFLETYRKMRRTYSGIGLSIHGGEVDLPGRQVHDTLLLGATRIGHGLNLITDPDTMLVMRNGKALVEINLISNRVLEYFPDLTRHPFPEFLRFGIPVCLNTDDRGSWDSNMTDEYFTAVTTFNLTWNELTQMARNSLQYAFADEPTKQKLQRDYESELTRFELKYDDANWSRSLEAVKPMMSGYTQRTLGLRP
jgi:adenosine deaminase CECR1